uniref:Transposase n=1 Tax=Globodera rostochiensis TaxID=31243 RepID=A0A914HLA0_GLORO
MQWLTEMKSVPFALFTKAHACSFYETTQHDEMIFVRLMLKIGFFRGGAESAFVALRRLLLAFNRRTRNADFTPPGGGTSPKVNICPGTARCRQKCTTQPEDLPTNILTLECRMHFYITFETEVQQRMRWHRLALR